MEEGHDPMNEGGSGDQALRSASPMSPMTGGPRIRGGSDGERATVPVTLRRAQRPATHEIITWARIKANRLSFTNYKAFMDCVLCNDETALKTLEDAEQKIIDDKRAKAKNVLLGARHLPFTDTDAYRLLKVATEAFLAVNCSVPIDPEDEAQFDAMLERLEAVGVPGAPPFSWENFSAANALDFTEVDSCGYVLPYLLLIRKKLPDQPIKSRMFAALDDCADEEAEKCYGIMAEKLLFPCMIELIWSYWHEEGMLVQTMNAISRRFQNVRGPADRDPLAMMELDPLRPLNNLLWGYLQDEQHRLSVVRRAYEYSHHYGLTLEGKAVPGLRPADNRSRFLEAFHQLLNTTAAFYRQDDDTTVRADGFPVLNALRDLHIVLSEGAHNQFGDLPSTARIEMLMQQWLLARPEFREALPTRVMVAYPEPWMDRVDAMNRLQGWTDTSVLHFNRLAVSGEQILLSVRFTRWSEITDADMAALWARQFRDDVQAYIHAYRAVTGVDLAAAVTSIQQRELMSTLPSVLIRQRLAQGQPALSAPSPAVGPLAPGLRARQGPRRLPPGR